MLQRTQNTILLEMQSCMDIFSGYFLGYISCCLFLDFEHESSDVFGSTDVHSFDCLIVSRIDRLHACLCVSTYSDTLVNRTAALNVTETLARVQQHLSVGKQNVPHPTKARLQQTSVINLKCQFKVPTLASYSDQLGCTVPKFLEWLNQILRTLAIY